MVDITKIKPGQRVLVEAVAVAWLGEDNKLGPCAGKYSTPYVKLRVGQGLVFGAGDDVIREVLPDPIKVGDRVRRPGEVVTAEVLKIYDDGFAVLDWSARPLARMSALDISLDPINSGKYVAVISD